MGSSVPLVQAPQRYVDWINLHLGFNPRGQQHSNALSAFIADDLRAISPRIDADIVSGHIIVQPNGDVHTRIAGRNIDLLLLDPLQPGPLHRVRASIEHKTLMTAHGKARKNRYGDIIAYANHVHNHNLAAISGATMIINTSMEYVNPDEFAKGVQRPRFAPHRWQQLIEGTIKLYADIPLRERADDPNDQPEALAIILIEYDGVNPARLITDSPAPQPGEQAYILTFYERITRLYTERFP